ncbi:BTB (POZ) domain-containing protein [Kappamyces sp. JEL0680]|nr:BTB (POZ) domain-containing protein [Kappamyces sp. JEL0680]
MTDSEFETIPISYSYTWSELCFPPLEFEFGPRMVDGKLPRAMVRVRKERIVQSDAASILDSLDLSGYIIKMAGTSIPDRITDMTENVMEATSVMEQHYAIKQKVKVIGHAFVTAIINVCTTCKSSWPHASVIAAFLQFLIAYHNAPGLSRGERNAVEMEGRLKTQIMADDELVTFSVGGNTFTTQLLHLLPRKNSKLGLYVFGRRNLDDVVFIDRDGTYFRHVLNHLRGTVLAVTLGADSVSHLRDLEALASLLDESKHYELSDLTEAVLTRMSELQS